jgi:predicted ArsR family transcriptional regulator
MKRTPRESAAVRLQVLARICQRGLPPTVRDLCRLTGMNPNGVVFHLAALRKAGLVTWENGKARTLRPTCRWIPASELEPA